MHEGDAPTPDGSARRSRSLFLFTGLLLVLGAAALRFYHIGTQSLWVDEGFTLQYADTKSLAATMGLILGANGSERFSPLYLAFLHGVIRVWGTSEFALRAFSAICGVAAVVAVIGAATAFFDRRTALLAGALMAASSFAVWYSQEARSYSLMILLVSLQLGAVGRLLHSARRDPTTGGRLPLAIISGVGLFGNILFAISSLSLCLAHLITAPDRRRWWAAWWPAGFASAPAMVFFLASSIVQAPAATGIKHLQQSVFMNVGYTIFGQLLGLTYGPPQATLRGPNKFSVLGAYLPALACAGLLGLALVGTLLMARRLRTSNDPKWSNCGLLGIALAVAAGCAVAFVAVTQLNWQPRHAYFVFPMALLVVAFALSVLSRADRGVPRGLVVVTLVAFLGTNAWSLHNYYARAEYGRDDYRGAAAHLNALRQPDVPSVLLGGSVDLLRYYGDTATIDLSAVPDSAIVPWMLALARPVGEIDVAINRRFYLWSGTDPTLVFRAAFEVQELNGLQYFDIYRLHVRTRT
jgi:4-amino-4-deoxy-L-arabinose transferase-like glycosyltransferase